jgi:geranylgeranyl pyrophosphate synthase
MDIKQRFVELFTRDGSDKTQAASDSSGIELVELTIASKLTSDAQDLVEISNYLKNLGGKRIRPLLALSVGEALGLDEKNRSLVNIAAGIELIHMATILHDDIIDHSPLRRHHQSPYIRFGAEKSLLCGDFLLTRAFGLCALLDDYVISETEKACIELTEGEILETPLYTTDHNITSYLTIAKKKTAALFKLAAICAGHIAESPLKVIKLLENFGYTLGVSFQMLDDILDVASDQKTLGKLPGTDIRERKPSLINILWISEKLPGYQKLLSPPQANAQQFSSDLAENEEEFIERSLKMLNSGELIKKARLLAQEQADQALKSLEEINTLLPTADLEKLKMLVGFTIERLK